MHHTLKEVKSGYGCHNMAVSDRVDIVLYDTFAQPESDRDQISVLITTASHPTITASNTGAEDPDRAGCDGLAGGHDLPAWGGGGGCFWCAAQLDADSGACTGWH